MRAPAEKQYYVKIRVAPPKGIDAPWGFLTPAGTRNRLKVHAALFATKERAEAVVSSIKEKYPEVEAKVVHL
jgi:hypothetical protein